MEVLFRHDFDLFGCARLCASLYFPFGAGSSAAEELGK
jgi:hypothetical protein